MNSTRRACSFPVGAAAAVVIVLASVIVAAFIGPRRIAVALDGFMPSSGGTRLDSTSARNGVGDGVDEAPGGADPKSVGYDNSDTFVNSDKAAGLYDCFIEAYGEPLKTNDFQKTIFLKRDGIRIARADAAVDDLRAGKQFALVRQPRRSTAGPQARAADGLLFVKGRTPLHLALTAYDRFDGSNWHAASEGQLGCMIEKSSSSNWMNLTWLSPSAALDGGGDVEHQIRIAKLATDRIPTPSYLSRFRMGRVNKPDFFGWGEAGIIKLAKRTVPAGALIETVSALPDREALRRTQFALAIRAAGELRPEVAALAREWSAGIPRGWEQIEAVVDRLRARCILDRGEAHGQLAAAATAAGADPIGEFLLRARRGPDYLFASSATLLLGELGYRARLVAGFYADPARYDASTEQTPLASRDVHFWAEVRTSGGRWVTIEPTPGYRTAGPAETWVHRTWTWAAQSIADHAGALVLTGLSIAGLLWQRLQLVDAALTLAWCRGPRRPGRRRVLATLTLIERRLAMIGRPRPPGLTPPRWFRAAAATAVPLDHRADLDRLADLASWAAFAPPAASDAPCAEGELHDVCRRLGLRLTARRMRRAAAAATGKRTHAKENNP